MTYDYPKLVQEAIESAEAIHYEWDEKNLEWPLTEESIVFEIGSYRGRWARQIAQRYNPRLYCFEPQEWAFNVTSLILVDFNVRVFNFALGTYSGHSALSKFGTDGASFVIGDTDLEDVNIREIGEVLQELKVDHIDLMLMNIEGYEAELLPHMFDKGILPDRLVVQCHGQDMRPLIAEKYDSLWDYGMTLSAWEIK